MRVSEAQLDGRRLAVVYDAAQLPLRVGSGRWATGRQVRERARANKATGLLRTVDEREGVETWWFGAAGVSFAAAVDAWSAGGGDIGPDVAVVIPLDVRVYFAARSRGIVEEEWVLAGERAEEKLAEWAAAGVEARAFGPGRQTPLVAGRMEHDAELPFDPGEYRYGRPLVVLARRGLFHPSHGLAALGVAVLPALAWVFWVDVQQAARSAADDLERQANVLRARQADFSGRERLLRFAGIVGDERMLGLHREGLAVVEYQTGTDLVWMKGAIDGAYPTGARRFAAATGGTFVVRPGGWDVVRTAGWQAAYGSVEGFRIDQLGADLFRIGRAAGARVEMGARVDAGEVVEIGFVFEFERTGAVGLAALGDGLAGRPVFVDRVVCEYAGWIVEKCAVEVRAKGMA